MSDDKKPATGAPAAAAPAPGAPPPKPPPKNPGMVTFTVDGKEVIAKPGTNMIEAAKLVGVEIPYYCYHPRLSIAANCRMCLVESSTSPKLVPACQTALAEGMAIKTHDRQGAGVEAVGNGVPAPQPPGGLPHLRPGRRVQAAGLLHALRPQGVAPRAARKVLKRNKRKVLGSAPWCSIKSAASSAPAASASWTRSRRSRSSASSTAARTSASTSSRASGLDVELLGQRRRHLPGRRAAEPRLPLPRACVVPLCLAQRLHGLRAGLLDVHRFHGPGHVPVPPARERRDQQELDVRSGPALVQVAEQGPRADGGHRSRRRCARGRQGRGGEAAATS